ncbi:MAG: hotdog fold thioesterase [Myxococcaceae bacterium]
MSNIHALATLSPFNNWLNFKLENFENGSAKLVLPWSDLFIGDPVKAAIHGGILAALIDATGGAACMSLLGKSDGISTIDLQINYLEPGYKSDFYCEAKTLRMGKRVGTARMEVYSNLDSENPTLVAIGTGVYNLVRQKAE